MKINLGAPAVRRVYTAENPRTVTIFFGKDPIEEQNARCLNCGLVVFTYEKEIDLIVDDGSSPKGAYPPKTICERCHLGYRLM